MTNEKLEQIIELLQGVSAIEWSRIKQHIDMEYSSLQHDVTLSEKEKDLLNYNLKREFSK